MTEMQEKLIAVAPLLEAIDAAARGGGGERLSRS
jgi:hypothetical protein